MKLIYICDYCREIYQSQELQGQEGFVELLGICADCLEELGLSGEGSFSGFIYQYH